MIFNKESEVVLEFAYHRVLNEVDESLLRFFVQRNGECECHIS